jgi:ferric-dicitrate binding protein FerR (iron transport regulator)
MSLRALVLSILLFPLAASAVPLGAARVSFLKGMAWRVHGAKERTPVAVGDAVAPGEGLVTGAGAETRAELSFGDGSLVRLGADTQVQLGAEERGIELRMGRILVQSDRMLGGLGVHTATLRLHPDGTTYLVALAAQGATDVTVLEGAVRVERATQEAESALVLPGETLHVQAKERPGQPAPLGIDKVLSEDPLITAPLRSLPSLPRIRTLAGQQRRGVLAGRNERLRTELGWQRPAGGKVTVVPVAQ